MPDYLQLLKENGILHGEFNPDKVSGLTPQWFWDRQVDFLDFRGNLEFRHTDILLGRHCRFITASHIISSGRYGETAYKRVVIEKNTFIGSYSLLYNCHIMENAVISCGSVVSNMTIPAFTMVAGNPAVLIGKFVNGLWRRVDNNLLVEDWLLDATKLEQA